MRERDKCEKEGTEGKGQTRETRKRKSETEKRKTMKGNVTERARTRYTCRQSNNPLK